MKETKKTNLCLWSIKCLERIVGLIFVCEIVSELPIVPYECIMVLYIAGMGVLAIVQPNIG